MKYMFTMAILPNASTLLVDETGCSVLADSITIISMVIIIINIYYYYNQSHFLQSYKQHLTASLLTHTERPFDTLPIPVTPLSGTTTTDFHTTLDSVPVWYFKSLPTYPYSERPFDALSIPRNSIQWQDMSAASHVLQSINRHLSVTKEQI